MHAPYMNGEYIKVGSWRGSWNCYQRQSFKINQESKGAKFAEFSRSSRVFVNYDLFCKESVYEPFWSTNFAENLPTLW